ncbi:putative AC transposase [Mycena sanguinolenta]|uniref:Putative AC transposase n=1 Tax=Mycena sanguinolenta TaxID=230812 RepID=A0A8H6XT60_9AGAR|nr:putative AC transposase [Mycena sanguinolenta]
MLTDINVQPIIQSEIRTNPSADVLHFSGKTFSKPSKGGGGDKLHRTCTLCDKDLVADVSTNRRHYAKFHKAEDTLIEYHAWCKQTDFESKLDEDVKARQQAQRAEELKKKVLKQQSLDPHLREKPARPVPYTDELFLDAAIQWLIATDQPIDALTHPKFKEMINIAARATEGINLPTRAQTRNAIIKLFHDEMNKLKIRLLSDAVTGMIHITCDAWQASNTDGYYAVTGHWMETSPGVWVLREALLGFTRMNNAHHGIRLGQTLFKIVERLGITNRIGYVTCDNATNNGTMLVEFSRQMARIAKIKWDPIERRINCLAHVINIATQKLISSYSKSLHYNPNEPHAHVPDAHGIIRDEIGLLRAIAVKERSSSQRKELFRDIQLRNHADPDESAKQMILDMKVRWSSTYAMLDRGYELREAVDQFVSEIAANERDREKSDKLEALQLSADEWTRIDLFLNVLQSAQDAQHQFSSDLRSTLHLAIPALEKLHAEWTSKGSKEKYSPFHEAIEAALLKVNEYYQKTSNSNSYVLAMVLDPQRKLAYFEKHWPKSLQASAKKELEKMFKERYMQLQVNSEKPAPTTSTRAAPSQKKCRRASTPTDDDVDMSSTSATHIDPTRPWLDEFNEYLQARETVPEGMSTVEWWGRNYHRYPVWGSLARDYLANMASSVSSERAFSSAGITISKRRNRLKGDIVEALQCLKSFIHRDILFRESVIFKEGEDDDLEAGEESRTDTSKQPTSWDILIDDDPDNYELPPTVPSTTVPSIDT